MCFLNNLLLILCLLLLLFYSYRRIYEKASLNIDTLSLYLEAPQISKGFLNSTLKLEGFYKGRKVILNYIMGEHNASGPAMELRHMIKPQKNFLFNYPRPTQNTQLRGNKVWYIRYDPFRGGWGNIPVYSDQELREILEELKNSAEIAEKIPQP